jgi:hypothetical protein
VYGVRSDRSGPGWFCFDVREKKVVWVVGVSVDVDAGDCWLEARRDKTGICLQVDSNPTGRWLAWQ